MSRTILFAAGFIFAVILYPPACAASDFQVKPASTCPALFGTESSRASNLQARKRYLELVEPNEHLVNLTYSGPWREPSAIRFKGISLLATLGVDGQSPSALLDLTGVQQGLDCAAGLYEIHVDDSLGSGAHVLAIVKDAVLFERGGKLFFLTASMAQEPIFRMIWRSTWTISGQQQPAGSSPRPASNRNYHKPKHVNRPSSSRRTGVKTTIRR